MKPLILITAVAIAAGSLPAKGREVPLVNPGFEDGTTGWTIALETDQGMTQVIEEAAHSGKAGLRIVDENFEAGGRASQGNITATPGATYKLTFWGRNLSGAGMAVLMVFRDAQGEWLNLPERGNEIKCVLPGDASDWKKYELEAKAPEDASQLMIVISSWAGGESTADVDDLTLTVSE